MRRALVLGDDAARHPFRQQLPRHIARGEIAQPMRERAAPSRSDRAREATAHGAAATVAALKRWNNASRHNARKVKRENKISALDVREFLLAYCACFIAAIAFLS